jgi:hypothetical protein
LWKNSTQPRYTTVDGLSSAPDHQVPSSVRHIPNCAITIQGRRIPSDGMRTESISGAKKNLNVHGRIAIAVMVAVSALVCPAARRVANRAMVAKPQGNP